MGRKPDPHVAKLRKEALRLETEQGLSVAQVAKRVGRSKATVKEWLREDRGHPKKLITFRAAILRHLSGRSDFEEIADRVGCSVGHVYRIAQEKRGGSRPRRSGEEMLAEVLSNPSLVGHIGKYPTLDRAFLVHCNQAVSLNPKAAKDDIELAIRQFDITLKRLRIPAKIRRVTCHLLQARAIRAARQRALERPAEALATLRAVQKAAAQRDCLACDADLARRESLILRDLRDFEAALRALRRSRALYELLPNSGHDPDSDGLGNCALTEANILHEQGAYRECMALAERARKDLDLNDNLRRKILMTAAWAAFNSKCEKPGIIKDLEQWIIACGPKPSLPHAKLCWLIAKVHDRNGDLDLAIKAYDEALYDVRELEIPEGVAAILADRAKLEDDPIRFARAFSDLKDVEFDGDLPPWLQPLKRILSRARDLLAREGVVAAADYLRAQGRGDRFAPVVVDRPARPEGLD